MTGVAGETGRPWGQPSPYRTACKERAPPQSPSGSQRVPSVPKTASITPLHALQPVEQRLDLLPLFLRRVVLQRVVQLLDRLRFVALLRKRHAEVIAKGRLVRRPLHQVAENLDGVIGQVLLQVDPAERVRDLRRVGEQL